MGTLECYVVYLTRGLFKGFFFIGISEHKILRDIPDFICTISIKSSKIRIFELYKVSYIFCVFNLLSLIKRHVSKV